MKKGKNHCSQPLVRLFFKNRWSSNDSLPWLLFLPGQIEMTDEPGVEQRQQREVGNENTRRHPLPAVEFPVRQGPQYRSRKKGIRMLGHVGQDM